MPFFTQKLTTFICDECGARESFEIPNVRAVRQYGWAISKDYKRCYCPKCKPIYTSAGCCGRATWRRG